MSTCRRFLCRLAWLLWVQFPFGPALALDRVEITLGDLQGEGWVARDVRLHLDIGGAGDPRGEIQIAALALADPVGDLRAIRLRCDRLRQDADRLTCDGSLDAAQLLGEAVRAEVRLEREAATGEVRLRLRELALAGGRWSIDARLQRAGWSFAVTGRGVDGRALLALSERLMPEGFGYSLDGVLDLEVQAERRADAALAVRFELASGGLEFANAGGTQAAERLGITVRGQGRLTGEAWDGAVQAELSDGALFVDPLFLEFAPANKLQLTTRLQWRAPDRLLRLTDLELHHTGVVDARADLALRLGDTVGLQSVNLDLNEARLPGAYLGYLQPWLHGQVGDALETAGRFAGHYRYAADGETALQLRLHEVDVVDAGERFGFLGLDGVIDWASDAAPRTTELGWKSGSLYRLALGPARVAVVSRGTGFALREPARIPVLDGALVIDQFSLSDPGADAMRWRFDGVLTPVSMEAVSTALGWPRFGGRLSGMIPAVEYAEGSLEIGGVLLVRAFDGDLTVRNLRLEQPFGRIPRLQADLSLENLDLDALTRTFEFGRIEGRLSGHVNGLRMEDWQPVAFDARFATPEDDRSRHRISQRAVDNLSSIGGGVGGALSRTFLGVFEDFPYDRIGLSCVLENGVCRMGGVAPAANGYYIVKGRFLPPRLDVVGFADRVDWHTLVDRLKSVTLDQAPTVR